jgi:hypothetical protein
MYEARHGAFKYTIERRLADDGLRSWHWHVTRGEELIASGVSSRSHAHAETVALSCIFDFEWTEVVNAAALACPGRVVHLEC